MLAKVTRQVKANTSESRHGAEGRAESGEAIALGCQALPAPDNSGETHLTHVTKADSVHKESNTRAQELPGDRTGPRLRLRDERILVPSKLPAASLLRPRHPDRQVIGHKDDPVTDKLKLSVQGCSKSYLRDDSRALPAVPVRRVSRAQPQGYIATLEKRPKNLNDCQQLFMQEVVQPSNQAPAQRRNDGSSL